MQRKQFCATVPQTTLEQMEFASLVSLAGFWEGVLTPGPPGAGIEWIKLDILQRLTPPHLEHQCLFGQIDCVLHFVGEEIRAFTLNQPVKCTPRRGWHEADAYKAIHARKNTARVTSCVCPVLRHLAAFSIFSGIPGHVLFDI